MYTLTVVAEDRGLGESKVKLKECGERWQNKIAEVLEEFKEQLDGFDGKYTGGSMSIELEADAKVISQKLYRIPDTLQQSVKQVVDKLLAEGKAETSKSFGLYQLFQCQSQTVPLDSVLTIRRSMQ